MKEKIILLGSGGHARSVVDAIESAGFYEIIGFVDKTNNKAFEYQSYRVIGCDEDLQKIYESGIHHAFICIGYLGQGDIRNSLYAKLKAIGYILPVIVDPTAVLAKDILIGEGSFVGKGAVINSGTSVGKMSIINTAAVLEHDCQIKDFCHVSVNCTLCGGVSIGNECFVGAGTTIIQYIKVGEHCVIGAGSLVLKDIVSEEKVYGVLARR